MTVERQIKYSQALREAIDQCMAKDPAVFIIGEGVPDPKGIFGSTLGLKEKYGSGRVMDMPVCENGMTGICIGAALRGFRPILTHQRVDFALLSLDQIINNAAKWHFMFGGQMNIPLVICMVVGRGWGQGAQHSQSLQALFAHIPGLKVIMPATPHDAKGLLVSAIEDDNPVISIEHRWLYDIEGHVHQDPYRIPLGKASVVRKGDMVTIAAVSHMTIEAIRAAQILEKKGITAEVIDLRSIRPLDFETVSQSVKKTGHLIVADCGWLSFGVSAEIAARATEGAWKSLKKAPRRIALPEIPMPSAPSLTEDFYPGYRAIVQAAWELLGKDANELKTLLKEAQSEVNPHDVPDLSFRGPF